jgi:phage protein D
MIEIDGEEVADVYDDLEWLEVELDEELPARWRLRLSLELAEGDWRLLDDTRFSAWKRVVVSAGLDGDPEELFSGYLTHVLPTFGEDPTRCSLELWGLDESVLLDRKDKLKAWPSKKDSDIASELFSEHGLSAVVDDTDHVHDEALSTVIQRETDWRFLRRLALRNHFECFVEGTTGYFRRPRLDGDPQAVLALHFGDDTNVSSLKLELNALTPGHVAMAQFDGTTTDLVDAEAVSSDQKPLGRDGTTALLAPGIEAASVLVAGVTTTGAAELVGLCRGLFDHQEWFVTGECTLAADPVEAILKPRATVTIKGIGERFSGVYLVTRVTHVFTLHSHTQTFAVKRNAVLPTGDEQFTPGSTGLL